MRKSEINEETLFEKVPKRKKLNRKTQFRKVQKYFFFSFLIPFLSKI